MAVTLAQAKLNVQDDLQVGVIDEFAKSNFLFNALTFDDVVSPTGGGATLTYGYTRLKTQPTAAFRAVNSEYTSSEVEKERITTDLAVFGGAFKIDRIIANMGGIVDEVTLQMQQKIKAASALFNDTVINGDTGVEANGFDGLEKALTGSSTEYEPSAIIDLSTSDLDGKRDFIGGNLKLIAKIRAAARRAGMYQMSQNEFGQNVETYNGIPLVDFGAKPGSNQSVVDIEVDGTTSLYVARLGLDGFHAISMAGQSPVNTWLPDYKTAGAVKTGEVDMVAGVALKATKAAGVMRKIKVQ